MSKECPYCYMKYNPVIERDRCPHELLEELIKPIRFPKSRDIHFLDTIGFHSTCYELGETDAWFEEILRFVKSFEDAWDNDECGKGDVEDFLVGLHERLKKEE